MGSDDLHPSKVSCLPLVLSFFFVQSQPSKKLYRNKQIVVADFKNRVSVLTIQISQIKLITASTHLFFFFLWEIKIFVFHD